MKTRLLAMLLMLTFVLSGCGGNNNASQPNGADNTGAADSVETKTMDPEIKAFFDTYINTNERPFAVMVDNDDKNARPHAGLNEAYLIYEMVVEGRATRFMAFYRGDETEKIGPVRSSRHYFLDYMMENDAIYTHYGWSPKAGQDITSFGIDKINGVLGTDEDTFWREYKYKGDWHSAYTSIAKIKEKAASKNYSFETDRKNGIKYSEEYFDLDTEDVANDISLTYCSIYKTGYTYNSDTKMYEKSINGAPHIMQNGEKLEVKNVIIMLTADRLLGDGSDRRDITTVGEGKGYYITNGAYEEITWSKSERFGNTTYKKSDGSDLYINPGKTIINIISPSDAMSIGE